MAVNVLVLSTHPLLSLPLVRSLGVAGYTVHLAETRAWSASGLSRHCHRYVPLARAAFDPPIEPTAQVIERYCGRQAIDVIVPADLDAALFVDRARPRLERSRLFPVPTGEILDLFHDKWRFAQLLERIGAPHPRTTLVADLHDRADVDWSRAHFIKPARGSFWVGAAKLEGPADLERYASGVGLRCKPPFVLQEFIPGEDIDISVLAIHGRVIASATQAMGVDAQTRVFVSDPRVDEVARRIVQRTGYHGVVHFDMRIDARSGSVVVFEANPRFWASLSYATWAGLNFADLGVRIAQGESLDGRYVVQEGPCRKPTLNAREVLRGILGGAGWSAPTRAAWRATFSDPLPHLVARVSGGAL